MFYNIMFVRCVKLINFNTVDKFYSSPIFGEDLIKKHGESEKNGVSAVKMVKNRRSPCRGGGKGKFGNKICTAYLCARK